jgi:hypothetical protein
MNSKTHRHVSVAEIPTGPPHDSLPTALTQLGLILTPAGLIALFCQILGVSSQATAASSLASAVLTAICIYRRYINHKIPSALLTALLVGLAAVFFFNYQDILLKDTGLIKFYRHSNDFLGQIDTQIEQAQEDIWFVGTNFNITAGERRSLLVKKLGQGIKVNFLVFDPHTPELDGLARDFDQSPAELKSECEKGLQSILQLQKDWESARKSSSNPGELQVHVFNVHPHSRLYVFDAKREQGTAFFIPYVNGVNSPETPGYLLRNVRNGVSQSYFGGVLKLWGDSVPLDKYLASQP